MKKGKANGLKPVQFKLLYKYVVTYVVILLLPVMMVGFVYQYFIQAGRRSNPGNLNLLSQVKRMWMSR